MTRKQSPDAPLQPEVWPTYPALLTIAQVATLLQVHERTIPNLIRNEGLPTSLTSLRTRRVHKSRLWNWLRDNERWQPSDFNS
ncbi:MAG: helix-turn-helix domain-containing protein [Acidimicrobiales bacterium]|nr:helix-turn-helix domain-containing protein [Acidimicrobiales bacterium]